MILKAVDVMVEFDKYESEVKEKWGGTDAYKQYAERAKNYSKKNHDDITIGLEAVMAEFAICMKSGNAPESAEAKELVKKLQSYITDNFYHCSAEILAGLGQMYVADDRFKANIDKHSGGTAQFICDAIKAYCRK